MLYIFLFVSYGVSNLRGFLSAEPNQGAYRVVFPEVARATKEALTCMSEQQSDDGGFASWGTANSESCVQMIVALCELGIELDDPRFVKNGNTMLDNLMTFYRQGEGFLHTQSGSGSNQMATEQGFYGLVAAQRAPVSA